MAFGIGTHSGKTFIKLILTLLLALPLGSGYEAELMSSRLKLAADYESSQQFTAAVAVLQNAISTFPRSSPLYIRLGDAFLKQGRYALAEDAFASAFRYGGGSPALVLWGDALFAQGFMDSALEKWQKALQLTPRDAGIRYRMGLAYLQMGRLEEAAAELEKASADIPLAFCPLVLIEALRNPAVALDYAARCNAPAWRKRPWVIINARDVAELKAILKEPAPEARMLKLGNFYLLLGHPHLAFKAFQEALDRNPNLPEAWAYLGYARSLLGQDPEQEFAHALRLRYPLPLTHYLWGLHLKARGKLDAAAQEFAYALARDPQNPAYCASLADVEMERGNYQDAEKWLRKATELAPEEPGFWLLLAQFYVDVLLRGDREAIKAARKAVELAPENPIAYEMLGRAYYHSGRLVLALQYLQKALQLAPMQNCAPEPNSASLSPVGPCATSETLRVIYYLGAVYASRGDVQKALELFRRIRELAPESPWADRARWAEGRLGRR